MSKYTLPVYRANLKATVANMGAAYGFTITIWATGTLADSVYHTETPTEIVLHATGAALVYLVLILILYRRKETSAGLEETQYPGYAFLHVLSIPPAIGITYLIYLVTPWPLVGYGIGGISSSLIYNLTFALELLISTPDELAEKLSSRG